MGLRDWLRSHHPRFTEAERTRLGELVAPLEADPLVRSMDGFVQHGSTTTLAHVRSVARLAFWLNARTGCGADERTLAWGAMLHDFYLYDWHGSGWRHSYRHASTACRNAREHFGVDDACAHVIECHMWPISPRRMPRSREAIIVCIADKVVSLAETLFTRE